MTKSTTTKSTTTTTSFRPSRRHALGLAAGALAASTLPAPAQLVRGVGRIIVGFPAGGPTDTLARRLAESLRGTSPRASSSRTARAPRPASPSLRSWRPSRTAAPCW